MRRFEFVEGSSAKFWMAGVEGTTMVVVYGKLGTAGTRKDKEFPSAEAAQKECDKKVAEKTREGYVEVAGADGAPPPAPKPAGEGAVSAAAAPKEKAAPPKVLPPSRFRAGEATPERVAAAVTALAALDGALGGRSWAVRQKAKRARQALARLGGVDPASHPALAGAIEGLTGKVFAGPKRLSFLRALELLNQLDGAAYRGALSSWKALPEPPKQVLLLAKLGETIDDEELALRVGLLLVDRPGRGLTSNESGWLRQWKRVQPAFESHATRGGTTAKKFFQGLDSLGDPAAAARATRLAKG
jgi:predicted DNA-binding WGR domain protein